MNEKEIVVQRNALGFQLDMPEITEILKELGSPANFLIFGCGKDSIFWHNANLGGRTVFIEDNEQWIQTVSKKYKELRIEKVIYCTKRSEWKALLDQPGKLSLELPDYITGERWDVILVDGPAGFNDDTPGRMTSIFMASKLIKKSGIIFVHDAHREVEAEYCKKYLGSEKLVSRVKGWSILEKYQM